jgi:hypothetical protein
VAATNAAATPAAGPTGTPQPDATAKRAAASAKPAINTAAIVGTQAAQEALFKALGGSVKGITPGDRLIAEAIDRQNAMLARQHREAMKGGAPLKVEKV